MVITSPPIAPIPCAVCAHSAVMPVLLREPLDSEFLNRSSLSTTRGSARTPRSCPLWPSLEVGSHSRLHDGSKLTGLDSHGKWFRTRVSGTRGSKSYEL